MLIFIVKPYVFLKSWAGKAILTVHRLGESFFREPIMRFLPVLAVFFLFLGANYLLVTGSSFASNKGILGGPDAWLDSLGKENQLALLEDSASPSAINDGYTSLYDLSDFLLVNNSAFSNTGSILENATREQNGIFVYKVQKGDTLDSLAKTFGVSTSTIVWANASVKKGKALTANQELIILPISGVLHQAAQGDTIESIAEVYNVNPQEIEKVNNLLGSTGDLSQGQKIIIPDGQPKKDLALLVKSYEQSLPNLNGYFLFPTEKSSWNWGILHPNNAVDIANICGAQIYASADGLVTETGNPNNWNNGYGGFVKIEHQNSTETLYGHTEENDVAVGDIIKQGDTIAKIGKSGNVHGTTGCHLHFEVHGAKNPFVK